VHFYYYCRGRRLPEKSSGKTVHVLLGLCTPSVTDLTAPAVRDADRRPRLYRSSWTRKTDTPAISAAVEPVATGG
jgi:hypothetical protein